MEICASCVYDKKTVVATTRENIKKFSPAFAVLFVFILFAFAVNLYDFIILKGSIAPSIFVIILTIFSVWYFWVILPKLNYKSQITNSDIINEYKFFDTKFTVNSTTKGINGNSEIEYSSLISARETKDYIFLYISKNTAYIINKSTIIGGTVEEIRNAIISQIGFKKYKIKCKERK